MNGAVVKGNALLLFMWVMRLLPIDWCSAIGYRLGVSIGPRNRVRDNRVRHNLAVLRPDLATPETIDASVRRFWGNMGRVMTEFAVLDRICRSDRTSVVGMENLEAGRATGRPRIGLFVHLGNWEVVGPKARDLGEDWLQIVQVLANPYRNRVATRGRAGYLSGHVHPGPTAGRQILRHLQAARFLSIAGDEYLKGELLAPSFGRPVRLDGNLARIVRLAKMTDALICPYFCVRIDGARFELIVQPPISLDQTDDDYLRKGVERLDATIAAIIVGHLDQWLMLDNFTVSR
jgi:KDO2-lipid IV(A) lauroyltransferase